MRPDEDLPGGVRVDEEGMVYSLDGGARTVYFCDRFRRYKFHGKAGGLALLYGANRHGCPLACSRRSHGGSSACVLAPLAPG